MRAVVASLALAFSINNAHAYIETICMTPAPKPALVTVRADDGTVIVRAGGGEWTPATSKVTSKNGITYVTVESINDRGTLIVEFSSEAGVGGAIEFRLRGARNTRYGATCVSYIH